MLRLSVECDEVPEEATAAVRQLSQNTGTYLRRVSPTYAAEPRTLTSKYQRCDQFLTLSTQRRVLAEIISRAPSSSVSRHYSINGEELFTLDKLPDFLFALRSYQSTPNSTSSESPRTTSSGRQGSLDFSPFRGATSPRKLRYEAYAAPQPVPSLRYLSSPRRTRPSVSSPEGRTRSLSRASDASNSLNELSKTITPGELTLAAAQSPFYALEVRIILVVPQPVAQIEIGR